MLSSLLVRKTLKDYSSPIHNAETLDDDRVQFARLLAATAEVLTNKQRVALGHALGITPRDLQRIFDSAESTWAAVLDRTTDVYGGITEVSTVSLGDAAYQQPTGGRLAANRALIGNDSGYWGQAVADVENCEVGYAVYQYDKKAKEVGLAGTARVFEGVPEVFLSTFQHQILNGRLVEDDRFVLSVLGNLGEYEVKDGSLVMEIILGESMIPID